MFSSRNLFRVTAGLICLLGVSAFAEQPEFKPLTASEWFSSDSGRQSAGKPGGPPATVCEPASLGSPYVPVDSWIYPAVFRLYGLGFLDHVFLGMRPWTRSSINRMLEDVAARIEDSDPGPELDQAQEIYDAIAHELRYDMAGPCLAYKGNSRIESVYTVVRGMSGTPLRDSYHLGSSIVNDYGRPFENGFNNYTGASAYGSAGRFTVYVRAEFHRAPAASGYSPALAEDLALNDRTVINYTDPATLLPTTSPYYAQATIPEGPIDSTTNVRIRC